MFKCGGFFSFRRRQWSPRHVETIDKSHCNLAQVPDDVLRHEKYLEELSLEANHLTDLPKNIWRMHKLRILNVSDNEIDDIPDELGNLILLEQLEVRQNDFRVIPEGIRKCKLLSSLDISNNTLGELPEAISKIESLKNFVANDIALSEIPHDIGSLQNLVILELRDNCIKFLPESFSFLARLERLDLGGNEMEELPDHLGELEGLMELWIDNNILHSIPPEIGRLKWLQIFDVSENKIEEIPEEISGCVALTDLILSLNDLHELPDGIGELKNLQILKADQNQIDELTSAIGGCTSLDELILTDNQIEFLPPSIGKLQKLSHFNVDRNMLFSFPPEIGCCKGLSVLSARENQITSLPTEIGDCSNLSVLALSGNRLENLPLTISTLPLKALWLSQNQSQSMLRLQIEGNSEDEKVLTCFLFPQEALKSADSLDGFMVNSHENALVDDTWHSPNRESTVQFGDDVELKESHLTRQATPYFKDISKIGRNWRESHPKKRANSDTMDPELILQNSSNESTPKKGVAFPDMSVVNDNGGFVNHALYLGVEENHMKDGEGSTNQVEVSVDILKTSSLDEGEVKSETIEQNEEEIADEHEVSHESDSDSDSSGHVRFRFDDAQDDSGSDLDAMKLIRKDTPHFLKGKRIVKSEDDDLITSEVNEILSKVRSSRENLASCGHQSNEDINRCNDEADGEMFANPAAVSFSDDSSIALDLSRGDAQDDGIVDSTREAMFMEESSEDETTPQNETHAANLQASHKFKQRDTESKEYNLTTTAFVPVNDHLFVNDEGECEDAALPLPPVHFSTVLPLEESFEHKTISKVFEELTTTLFRDEGSSLGFNIAGGKTSSFDQDEEASLHELLDDEGVFITKIQDGGLVEDNGVLKVGDKVIKVNTIDISNASHESAVEILKNAGRNITIVVLRELTDEQQIHVALENQREDRNVRFASEPEVEDIEIESEIIPVLLQRDSKGLGFSIAGGKGATPYQRNDESVFISKISENGPAHLDKRLKVGDKILAINNTDIRSAKHDDVVRMLMCGDDRVSIVTYRERVLNKKMTPLSQLNGSMERKSCPKSHGEPTKAEEISEHLREDAKLLVEEVLLRKSSGPLGLSIVGGSDHASHPFGVNEPGIFVSKINPDGEAARTQLCVGDRILRVNDTDMQQATHQEAVTALIANSPEIRLLVRHDPPPPGIQEIKLTKSLGEKLGISIRGGAKGHPGNPFDKTDEGIFVSKVNSQGAAARDTRLKVGMRILEVNNTSLLGASHVDAVRALRTAGDELTMIACDGYDPQLALEMGEADVFFNPLLCEPPRDEISPDSQSSATSGDSMAEYTFRMDFMRNSNGQVPREETSSPNYNEYIPSPPVMNDIASSPAESPSPPSSPVPEEKDKHGNKVKRTPSEQRLLDADKRAKWRQDKMRALEMDAVKAKAVIAQAKALSSSSLEACVYSDTDERTIVTPGLSAALPIS